MADTIRLGWVTSAGVRGRDSDEPLALSALAELGAEVAVVDWDDPGVDWAGFDRVVIRSTWDYPERRTEFDAWLARVDAVSELLNPIDVMWWSMDKHYLAELAAAGIPITASEFVELGQQPRFPSGDAGFVVKPAVGAGGRDVIRYPDTADARGAAHEHVAALHHSGRSVVVQPNLRNVATLGEWPMVFIGGIFSHAASRRVMLPGFRGTDNLSAPEHNRAASPTPDMLAVATAVVGFVHTNIGPTTYARIDLVLDDDGQPCVLEAELVEPSLFLPQHPPAAVALAVALTQAV